MARKKSTANKVKVVNENKQSAAPDITQEELLKMPAKQVKVRIMPQRGVGGFGGPGTVTKMPRELAEHYVSTGYVKILE